MAVFIDKFRQGMSKPRQGGTAGRRKNLHGRYTGRTADSLFTSEKRIEIMKRKPLSQRDCDRLKVGDPPLNDGHALSLTALSPDRKVWRYRYRLAGKPGSFTIGY
jgi:hypothetical protein